GWVVCPITGDSVGRLAPRAKEEVRTAHQSQCYAENGRSLFHVALRSVFIWQVHKFNNTGNRDKLCPRLRLCKSRCFPNQTRCFPRRQTAWTDMAKHQQNKRCCVSRNPAV